MRRAAMRSWMGAFAASAVLVFVSCKSDVSIQPIILAPAPTPSAGDTGTTGGTTHTVSVTTSNCSLTSAPSQTIARGASSSFTVRPVSGFELSRTVSGTCPAGVWSGDTYKIGPLLTSCDLTFSALPGTALTVLSIL